VTNRPSLSSAGGSVYVLYYSPGAASFAVHWLLIELGVPFEARRLDLDAQEHKRPEYLKLNPNGLVPTLLIDGKPVYESGALVALLAERHPEDEAVAGRRDGRAHHLPSVDVPPVEHAAVCIPDLVLSRGCGWCREHRRSQG
jgi:hypothetical protein